MTLYERIVQAVKNAGVTTEQVKQCENGRSMVAGSVMQFHSEVMVLCNVYNA